MNYIAAKFKYFIKEKRSHIKWFLQTLLIKHSRLKIVCHDEILKYVDILEKEVCGSVSFDCIEQEKIVEHVLICNIELCFEQGNFVIPNETSFF